MAESFDQLKGGNSEGMEISGDDSSETGFLQEIVSADNLDQSMDSLKNSYNVPMFQMDQSSYLQRSQGFSFSAVSPQNTGVTPSFCFSEASLQNTGVIPGHSNLFLSAGQGTDGMSKDVKSVFISSETGLATIAQCVGTTGNTLQNNSQGNQNQTVFNTGAFLMSIQNSNPGTIAFAQTNTHPDGFKSDNVFTFGGEPAAPLSEAESSSKTMNSSSGDNSHGDGKGSRSKLSTKQRQRKSRSQSASSETIQRTEPQLGCSPSQLETSELQSTSELACKPSLLDEILTEKKMALMQSPEVLQFLQSQQKKITHGQYTES